MDYGSQIAGSSLPIPHMRSIMVYRRCFSPGAWYVRLKANSDVNFPAGSSILRETIFNTIMITPSGALSPGPLSASAVAAGAGLGITGGVLVALGHLIVELPYFYALVRIMTVIERKLEKIRILLDLLAASFMALFSVLLIMSGVRYYSGTVDSYSGSIISDPFVAVITGIALTGLNGYFLAWWITVGKPIIDGATKLSSSSAMIVYAIHYSFDLGWLAFLAILGRIGGSLGARPMSFLMFILAGMLLYYMVRILVQILVRYGLSGSSG